jgi:acyl carrier protein
LLDISFWLPFAFAPRLRSALTCRKKGPARGLAAWSSRHCKSTTFCKTPGALEETVMQAKELIAEVLRNNISIPHGDTPLADLDGWDSLKGVRLVLRLEEIVGRELSEDDIERLRSVSDVERLLKAA